MTKNSKRWTMFDEWWGPLVVAAVLASAMMAG
jgi:hypothetical protein